MIEGKERKYCPKYDSVDYRIPLLLAVAITVATAAATMTLISLAFSVISHFLFQRHY
jgi:hypothetical protein